MAMTGSHTTTVAYDTNGDVAVQLQFKWTVVSQDASYRYLDCSMILKALTYGAITSTASKSYSVTVNGTSYSGTCTISISNNATKTLWSKSSIAIPIGTTSFSYSYSVTFDITFNATIGTKSGSSTGTLGGYCTVTTLRGQTVKYTNSSGTSTLSDERIKTDWKDLDGYDRFFDLIKPQAFKYTYSQAKGRYHLGFSAQSIENALAQSGLFNEDFAGLIQYRVYEEDDPETYHGYDYEYGLIYTEFVGLLTDQMQKVKKRTDALETQSVDINDRLSALENKWKIN